MIALSAKLCDTEKLFQRLEETEASHAIERCIKRMERSITGHGGRLVSTTDCELLATFDAAEHACQAAIDMQTRGATLPPVSGLKLPIRIGLHYTTPAGADASLAPALLVAARLAGLAASDQILATSGLIEELPRQTGIISRRQPEIGLVEQGEARLDVVAIDWRGHEPDKSGLLASPAANQAMTNRDSLVVRHHGKRFLIDATSPSLTIGRDASNQLTIANRKASRSHGLIEHRNNRYFYIDRSTNGSHVGLAGQDQVMVRRQEIELTGSGRIYFGGPASDPQSDFVEFARL